MIFCAHERDHTKKNEHNPQSKYRAQKINNKEVKPTTTEGVLCIIILMKLCTLLFPLISRDIKTYTQSSPTIYPCTLSVLQSRDLDDTIIICSTSRSSHLSTFIPSICLKFFLSQTHTHTHIILLTRFSHGAKKRRRINHKNENYKIHIATSTFYVNFHSFQLIFLFIFFLK